MAVHILGVEFAIKGLIDVPAHIVSRAKQVRPGQRLLLTFALLFQHIWADECGARESLVPVVHEDVVFGVVGDDVFDGSEFVDATTDLIGKGDG